MLKADVLLVNPSRRPRFKFSPKMTFAIEIRQYQTFGLMTDGQRNIGQTLLALRTPLSHCARLFLFLTLGLGKQMTRRDRN
jgi:hypothetical protein